MIIHNQLKLWVYFIKPFNRQTGKKKRNNSEPNGWYLQFNIFRLNHYYFIWTNLKNYTIYKTSNKRLILLKNHSVPTP